ncbi:MAG: lytic transglycosylase domain-containing protein [Pseudomonadales bacterium]
MMGRSIAKLGLLLCLIGLALPAVASIPYASCFARSAMDYDLAEDLLIAVSATESNWNAMARSHANAHGLMQIQWPGTAKHLGVRRVSDLYKPCTNIELGARYLRELLDSFEGDERKALAAYNYGPGRIRKAETLPAGAKRYIATVNKHRKKLSGGKTKASNASRTTSASKTGGHQVLKLQSRSRALRYVKVLNGRVRGAHFSHARTRSGEHAIVMSVGSSGLSSNDKLILKTFGWQP